MIIKHLALGRLVLAFFFAVILAVSIPAIAFASPPEGCSELSEDELAGITGMGVITILPGSDIYAEISGNAFKDAGGVTTIIQVPGNGNYIPVNINLDIDIFIINCGGTVINFSEVVWPQ